MKLPRLALSVVALTKIKLTFFCNSRSSPMHLGMHDLDLLRAVKSRFVDFLIRPPGLADGRIGRRPFWRDFCLLMPTFCVYRLSSLIPFGK